MNFPLSHSAQKKRNIKIKKHMICSSLFPLSSITKNIMKTMYIHAFGFANCLNGSYKIYFKNIPIFLRPHFISANRSTPWFFSYYSNRLFFHPVKSFQLFRNSKDLSVIAVHFADKNSS